jgi:hypothetical protein
MGDSLSSVIGGVGNSVAMDVDICTLYSPCVSECPTNSTRPPLRSLTGAAVALNWARTKGMVYAGVALGHWAYGRRR